MTNEAAAIPLAQLLLRFESLGDNCEFGLVQRQAGAEPLGLLRFASPYVPIETRLPTVVKAIDRGFRGLGELDTVHLKLAENREPREFLVHETAYQLLHHTYMHEGEIDPEELRRKQAQRLGFLRNKLMADLAEGEKIWVWKSNLSLSYNEVRPLLDLLRRFGPNKLLWVTTADAEHAPGTAERMERDLVRGYVDRFAPYDRATDISFESWYSVCRAAHSLYFDAQARNMIEVRTTPSETKPDGTRFVSRSLSSMTVTVELQNLRDTPFSRAVLAEGGTMEMPRCHVMNKPATWYDVAGGWANPGWAYPNEPSLMWDALGDRVFPRQVAFPEMWLARLDDAYCLPYAPPFLPHSRILINDFLVPWLSNAIGWFEYEGEGTYRFPFDITEYDSVDTAFFLGHPISGHFGHFIGDCLSRMHAWHACRKLFPAAKVVIDHAQHDTRFRDRLLKAAGVDVDDVLVVQKPVRCRRLLLASPALGVAQYASPTSSNLWREIRDGFGNSHGTRGDRIYLSRSGQRVRKLLNEAEVENLFRKFGFQVVRAEDLSLDEQISIISGAELVAGPGGSGMFNLAFQKHLKSVLILATETFMQLTEWFSLAGTDCTLYYHIGSRTMPAGSPVTGGDFWRVDLSRLAFDIEKWLSEAHTSSHTADMLTAG